jgi:LMBR1 domain-containing protein 1
MWILELIGSRFRYEEWDIDTSTWQRVKGALKYSLCFVALVVILMAVGLFIPAVNDNKGHFDLDYFKRLLLENSIYISS